MTTKSKLDTLIAEAVDLVRDLETLDADCHLTYKAYFDEALQIAECDEKRIAAIKKLVYEKHGTEHIQAYLRRYSKTLTELRDEMRVLRYDQQDLADKRRELRKQGAT